MLQNRSIIKSVCNYAGEQRRKKLPLRFIIFLLLSITMSLYATEESESVFKLAERFYTDSLYNLAQEQYQKFLGFNKRKAEYEPVATFKIAYCHYKMGNFGEAAEGLEEYVRLYPSESNIIDALYYAAVARRKSGDLQEASELFFSVWSRFSGSSRARSALFEAAQCAENNKNYDRALELYHQYLDRFADTENAKQTAFSLMEMHINRQEYVQVEKIIKTVENRWKNDKEFPLRILYYKALLAMKQQKMEDAEKKFELLAERDKSGFPENIAAYTAYGNVLIHLRKFSEALPIFDKLNEIFSRKSLRPQSTFLVAWADNARRAEAFEKAVSLYQNIMKEYSEEVDTYLIQYRLAECLVGKGDFPKAIETLRGLENSDSAGEYRVKAVLKTAELYYSKGLYPSAIAAYRRFLTLPEQNDKDMVIYRIGKIYQDKYQRYGAALREYENLIKMYPASSIYMQSVFAAAQCQEALKEYTSAVRNYDYIAESGSQDKIVQQAAQRAEYIRTFLIKDTETAVYLLADLLQKDPSTITKYERLSRNAEIFERNLNQYHKALELYGEIEQIKPQLPDSVIAYVRLRKASIYRQLYRKAQFENNPQMAAFAKENALKHYEDLIQKFSQSVYADEAAFNIMMMTSPGINTYEQFVSKYPTSVYLPEVFNNIASCYEKEISRGNIAMREKAVDAYRKIVVNFPSSQYAPEALIGLARNYLDLGLLDSTEKMTALFSQRYQHSVHDPELLYIKGILAGKQHKYEDAVTIFKQILYRYPFSIFAESARYELAFAELKIGDLFEALNNYRFYLQNFPSGEYIRQARYGVAKCLMNLDKRDEAIDIFTKLLNESLPDDIFADIHYELAKVAEEKGKLYDALNHLKTVLSVDTFDDKMTILKKMGAIYFNNRVYDDAADAFSQALTFAQTQIDSVEILTRSITASIMHGNTKKADKQQRHFKDNYGDTYQKNLAEILYHEGMYLLVEKEYDKAINRFKYIEQKFESSDRLDDASYQIALAKYYQNKIDESLELFIKFPVLYPTSEFVPLSFFKIAMIFHGKNDFIQAAQYFSKVIVHEKVDSKTRFRAANNAAIAYQKTSSWLDAARMYQILLSEYADQIHQSSYHLKVGFCLIQASKIEEALDHFKKSAFEPQEEDKPEIHYWLGTCYAKLGNYNKAIVEYLKVPYLYAGIGKWGITAEFEAARLYERQADYSKAITLYKKIVRTDGEQGRFGKQALLRIKRLDSLERDKE